MTIAIGINLGLYAIFAAVTRTTYYRLGMPFFNDNSLKIQRTTMGLITGAGFCALLDSVKDKLANEEVTSTERVLGIIDEETESIFDVWGNNSNTEDWIAQTG